MKIRGCSLSDVGLVRKNNEDSIGFFPERGLFVVADGMGGHAGGEHASQAAVRAISEGIGEVRGGSALVDAIRAANAAILERAESEPALQGMGTTVVALSFEENGRASVAHAGDSRAYRLRDGELERLTADHSVVNDLVRQGQLSPSEASSHPFRHTLTRVLGGDPDLEPDCQTFDVRPGDLYVLCSDGVSGMVPDDAIHRILVESGGEPERVCRDLVEAAKAGGGKDNATVIAVACEGA